MLLGTLAPHVMYLVASPPARERDVIFFFLFSTSFAVHTRTSTSLLSSNNSLCAMVTRSGVSALLAIASRWHGKLFSADLFGSVERMWEFLRLTSVVEKVSE